MRYEISREIFKQRLEERLNFVLVDVGNSSVTYENVESIPFAPDFAGAFSARHPKKDGNVLLYSLRAGDEKPALAADALEAAGYQFVYFYRGSEADVVLDKGLN